MIRPPGWRNEGEWITERRAVALLVLAWGVYVGRFWLVPPPAITSSDDGVLYVAAALHLREPALFVNDWTFHAMAPVVEPLVYTRVLAFLLPWWETPESLLRALSALLIGVFAVGVFALVRVVTGQLPVALLAGLIALRPRMGFLFEWGILMSQPLARSVIMAVAPWLLLWIWHARSRPWRLMFPGFVIGLLALVHPLSALQLGLVAVLQELLMRRGVRAIGGLGAGVILGGWPALLRHGVLIADSPAPVWFLRFRNPELLPHTIPALVGPLVYDFGVPLLLLAITLRASRAYLTATVYRWLCAGMIAAVVLTLATILAPVAPALARLSLGRASGFCYLFLSVPVLTVAWAKSSAGSWPRIAAMALVAALALSTGAWWDALLDRAIAAVGIPLGGRSAWNPSRPPQPLAPVLAADPEREAGAFRELADWMRRDTDPAALVLAPPGDAARLRLYGRRGIVVATKDAGLFIFSAAKATAWYARFREVTEAYASHEPAPLVVVAQRYGASYIVTAAGQPPMSLPRVFVNGAYVVYKPTN